MHHNFSKNFLNKTPLQPKQDPPKMGLEGRAEEFLNFPQEKNQLMRKKAIKRYLFGLATIIGLSRCLNHTNFHLIDEVVFILMVTFLIQNI